jgi:Family of unknown function (DUF6152)
MANKLLFFPIMGVLMLLSLAGTTQAHHGINAWYDPSKTATLKGTVTSFEWTNPHSYIHADVQNEKGAREIWSAEMGSVAMLSRFGWRRDTLKQGDQITLVGNPARDRRPMMILDKVVLANGQELHASDRIPGTPIETPK